MQEAFVSAWQKLPEFRGDSQFGSWVYRIATNTVMMYFRSRQRRLKRVGELGEMDIDVFAAPEVHTGDAMDLEQAIGRLPEKARIVFVLHDVEGRQHDEIAELTGTAIGTCKAQLHRARKLLREKLQ